MRFWSCLRALLIKGIQDALKAHKRSVGIDGSFSISAVQLYAPEEARGCIWRTSALFSTIVFFPMSVSERGPECCLVYHDLE